MNSDAKKYLYWGGGLILVGVIASQFLSNWIVANNGELTNRGDSFALGLVTFANMVLQYPPLVVGGALVGAGLVINAMRGRAGGPRGEEQVP